MLSRCKYLLLEKLKKNPRVFTRVVPNVANNFFFAFFQTNSSAVQTDDHLRKMFLGGLTPNTNEDMIRNFFYQFGEIEDIIIMRDTATKRSRGFGFITFKSSESVDKAQAARPHVVDGR